MGINPSMMEKRERNLDMLDDMFRPGESPYFAMYRAGKYGIPIEDVVSRLTSCGIAIRAKDIENWQRGWFDHELIERGGTCLRNVGLRMGPKPVASFDDLPRLPPTWKGTKLRFFPCTHDNRPMQRWGWSADFNPHLHDYASAKALSPCGWVGQNMLYQKFIVMDIDGRGHGEDDLDVIRFGMRYKDITLSYEDPLKKGSFHLYFSTDRLIPVRHFPHAKLDLMGNAVNAAVYMKNKVGNGLQMMQLTKEIWDDMVSYQERRRKQ